MIERGSKVRPLRQAPSTLSGTTSCLEPNERAGFLDPATCHHKEPSTTGLRISMTLSGKSKYPSIAAPMPRTNATTTAECDLPDRRQRERALLKQTIMGSQTDIRLTSDWRTCRSLQ